MKLTFLGTSAGMPTVDRNVTALALALDDSKSWYLVDCGEGTQYRLLHCRYTLKNLKAIFITHVHGDHTYGLPGLITSASMQGRTDPLIICGPAGIREFVSSALAYSDVHDMPFKLQFIRSDESGFSFENHDISVSSHELSHRVPSFAYRFAEKTHPTQLDTDKLAELKVPRGPQWGFLQSGQSVTLDDDRIIQPEQVMIPPEKGRIAVIGGDNDQPSLLLDALKDADILVHEATFTEEIFQKTGPGWMHSTARMVAETAEESRIPMIILTHFSGRFRLSSSATYCVELLRQEARKYYNGQIELARDLDSWQLSYDRKLIKIS